jgi:hypothetical protein
MIVDVDDIFIGLASVRSPLLQPILSLRRSRLFTHFDADKSGYISSTELSNALRSFGCKLLSDRF